MGVDKNADFTRVVMIDNGTIRYFVMDHLGSTTKLINTNGSEYSQNDYKAWGTACPPDLLRRERGDDPNLVNIGPTFEYTNQREAEVGLYYYIASV